MAHLLASLAAWLSGSSSAAAAAAVAAAPPPATSAPPAPAAPSSIALALASATRGSLFLHLLPSPLVAHVDSLLTALSWRATGTFEPLTGSYPVQFHRVALPTGEDLLIAPCNPTPVDRHSRLVISSLNTDAPARTIDDAILIEVLAARPGQPAPLLLLMNSLRTRINVTHLSGEVLSSLPPQSMEAVHRARLAGPDWLAVGFVFVRLPLLAETVPLPPRLCGIDIDLKAEIAGADGAERLYVMLWSSAEDEWAPCPAELGGVARVQVWDLRSGSHLLTVPHTLTYEWDWSLCAALDVAYCCDEDGASFIHSLANGALIARWGQSLRGVATCGERLWLLEGDVLHCYNKYNGTLTSAPARTFTRLLGDVLYYHGESGATLCHLPSDTLASLGSLPTHLRVQQAVYVGVAFVVLLTETTAWHAYLVEAAPPHAKRLLGSGNVLAYSLPSLVPSPHPLCPPLVHADARVYCVALSALPRTHSVLAQPGQ